MATTQEPIHWRYRFHIYKAYFSGLCFREYPHKIWPNNMVLTYLHFRILEISHWCTVGFHHWGNPKKCLVYHRKSQSKMDHHTTSNKSTPRCCLGLCIEKESLWIYLPMFNWIGLHGNILTGNRGFPRLIWGFPINFPLNQSMEHLTLNI